jgi:hypothetical protein
MITLKLSTVDQATLRYGLKRLIEIHQEGITRVPVAEAAIPFFQEMVEQLREGGGCTSSLPD